MAAEDKQQQDIVRINVGGTLFQCYAYTLRRYPDTRLANLCTMTGNTHSNSNEHFFDRDSVMFRHILNAYRTGELHLPKDACSSSIHRELEFWGLSSKDTAACCWKTLYKAENEVKTIQKLAENYKKNGNMCMMLQTNETWKRRLWLFLDEPRLSRKATAWAIFISTVVFLSAIISALEMVPEFRQSTYNEKEKATIEEMIRRLQQVMGINNITETRLAMLSMRFDPVLSYIDALFFVFISTEVVLRLICCPSIRKYITSVIHIAEMISIVVFWASFAMERSFACFNHELIILYISVKSFSAFKLFRLLRIVKLVPAFDILALSVTSSKSELGILACLLLLLTSFFGYIMYAAEMWWSLNFPHVFAAMYWSLITLTTVGYGDYYPETVQGCIVACACSVCGVLTLALPVGIIASNFHSLYCQHKYAYKHIHMYKCDPAIEHDTDSKSNSSDICK